MKRLYAAVAAVLLIALAGCGGPGHRAASQSATGSVHPPGWGATPTGVTPPRRLFTLTPTATMYDAVNLSNIPASPFAAAGYTSGLFPTWPTLLREFPSAHKISIAINASHHADCLDVEPFDATPAQAGGWVRADLAAGFRRPCVYSDLAEMPAVKASLAAAGLSRGQYFLWLAWYRNVPGLVAGYDAVQYTETCLGRNLDCSTVSLTFLTIAQPPYVPPPPPPPPLPVCFHKRESRVACGAVKAKVASDGRAVVASRRALNGKLAVLSSYGCRRPYRRGVCVQSGRAARVFAQRVRWFTRQAETIRVQN